MLMICVRAVPSLRHPFRSAVPAAIHCAIKPWLRSLPEVGQAPNRSASIAIKGAAPDSIAARMGQGARQDAGEIEARGFELGTA